MIDPTDPHFAALVVAVRGTERIVDHIVNANSRPIAAADFLVILSVSTFPTYSCTGISQTSISRRLRGYIVSALRVFEQCKRLIIAGSTSHFEVDSRR